MPVNIDDITEEDNILQERWEEYKSGKTQFDSWENVEKRLRDEAAERQRRSDDELPY